MTDSRLGLHRRYRPRSFAELTGQRHVSAILRRAVVNDTVPQQILFAGGSGLGKTTVARICAAAIMCETPLDERDDGDVCGRCSTCRDVLEVGGHHPDLIEFDAASHGGKDDVRDIASRAALSPMRARRKVYIIDEAHGLSGPGGEAFLKLLEEPPAHVVFMLATTDPQKMLSTNRGRCMELELLRPRDVDIVANLQRVAKGEGWALEDRVADALVQATSPELGVRGTLMSLEKLSGPLMHGDTLSDDDLAELLGVPPTHQVSGILARIHASDRPGALDATVELRQRVSDTALRRALLRRLRQDFLDASAGRSDTPADVALVRYELLASASPGEVGTEVAIARLASAHLVPDAKTLQAHLSGAEEVIARLQELLAAAEQVGLASSAPKAEQYVTRSEPVREVTPEPAPVIPAAETSVREAPPAVKSDLPKEPSPAERSEAPARLERTPEQQAERPAAPEEGPERPDVPTQHVERAEQDLSPVPEKPAPETRRPAKRGRSETPHVVPAGVDLGWGMPVPTVEPIPTGAPPARPTRQRKPASSEERPGKRPVKGAAAQAPSRRQDSAPAKPSQPAPQPVERSPQVPAGPDRRTQFLDAVNAVNPGAARFLAQGCRFVEEDEILFFLIPASRLEAVRQEGLGRIVSAAIKASGVKVKLRPYEE